MTETAENFLAISAALWYDDGMRSRKLFAMLFLTVPLLLMPVGCGTEGSAFTPDNTPAAHTDHEGASVKKGVSVSRYADGTAESAERLKELGVGWYYNWSDTPSRGVDAEFVPMLHGAADVNPEKIEKIKTGYEDGTFRYLLAFNEPDGDISGGGNPCSVETALNLWPMLEEIGIPLSSPAVTNPFQPNGRWNEWFDDFMTGAKQRGYRVDFIAIHFYQDFSQKDAHATLRKQLIQIYEKYQLPIWITEFGCIDISAWDETNELGYNPACTLSAAKSYTENVTKMLESLGFIERYSWFVDNFTQHGAARPKEAAYTPLFNDDDTISETGKIYRDVKSAIPLYLDTKELSDAERGKWFYLKLSASGGEGDHRFSTTPPPGVTARQTLPRGLSLSASGELYGTPELEGEYTVCIAVTDGAGQTAYRLFSFFVEEP